MARTNFSTQHQTRRRTLDVDVQNYYEGEGNFTFWRRNVLEGVTESQKRSLRKVTNLKKYGARMERRKIKQQLNLEMGQ